VQSPTPCKRLQWSSAPTPVPAAPGQSALRYSDSSSSFEVSFVPNLTGITSTFNWPLLWGTRSPYIDMPYNYQRIKLISRLIEKIKLAPECFEVPKNFFEIWGGGYGEITEKLYGKETTRTELAALEASDSAMKLLISMGYIPCNPCFSDLGVMTTRRKFEELVAEGVIPSRKPFYEALLKEYEPDYKPTKDIENK
jgi:hypothetical protein